MLRLNAGLGEESEAIVQSSECGGSSSDDSEDGCKRQSTN